MDDRERHGTADAPSVGFWSGIVVAGAGLAFSVAAVLVLLHALTPPWDAVLPLVPSLVLAPSFLTLFVTMHSQAPAKAKPWTRLAAAFACVYVPLCTTAYVVELSVVEPFVLRGEADRVALLTLTRGGWGGGVLNAVDGLGYVFMCLACFAAAPAFRGERLERVIRVLLVANGVLVVPIALTYFVSPRFIFFTFPWGLTVPGLAVALGIHLRRKAPASREPNPRGRSRCRAARS